MSSQPAKDIKEQLALAKKMRRRLIIDSALIAIVSLLTGGTLSWAIAPGSNPLGNVLGGSGGSGNAVGQIFGGIFGGGGSRDTLYDFETVFNEGDSSGGIAGVLGDLMGGIDGLGVIEDILSANGGDIVSPCGIVIMNFAPTNSNGCSGDGSGTGNILFDTVFQEVGAELGLPSEITDVIIGRQKIEDVIAETISAAIENDLGIQLPETMNGDSVMGAEGIPDPEALAEVIETYTTVTSNASLDPALNVFTPNVNTALSTPILANKVLTNAITNKGLSAEGQEISEARFISAQAAARTSGLMAESATDAAQKQLMSALRMNDTIRNQESTQDTLKEALTGNLMLHAQSTQMLAGLSNQAALQSQMEQANLVVTQEMRDGVFANGLSLQLLNEQTVADSQRELAGKESLRYESMTPHRMMGAFR